MRGGLIVALVLTTFLQAAEKPPRAEYANGAVVCVSQPAAGVGAAILKNGGNAVDAAIATALAMAVTFPEAGNIGGGGFMLVYVPNGEPLMFDFREVAPKAATEEMFLAKADRTPHRRVAVPGTVRGLAMAHAKFGTLPWKDLTTPAVMLANDGFAIDAPLATALNEQVAASTKPVYKEFCRVFSRPDGKPWKAGDTLKQPELGKVMARIADKGADGFYLGDTADLIAAEMKRGGLITTADLAAYKPEVRKPLTGSYRGYEIIGLAPPSSGGIGIIEMLNILENFDIKKNPRFSADTIHLMTEAMRRSYRDRAADLGDPAFYPVELTKLQSKKYGKELAASINPVKATLSKDIAGELKIIEEPEHTTHFSVVDKSRMCVSLTYTLESSYGSRVVVTGAGFILNDEMNDFGWIPDRTDIFGRIGTLPNRVRPGQRPISSMSSTIVLKDGKPYLVTGSPGGRTIINTVLNVLVSVLDYDMPIEEAVAGPRFHHQWFPDAIRIEQRFADELPDVIAELKKRGHNFEKPIRAQGDAHSIRIDPKRNVLETGVDTRRSGASAGY